MSKIELRLSDVEPPLPEPKRTIYRDIVNLPSTVKLGLTIRYFNHDDVDLYFQITGSGTGYTFGTVNLGLLASGADAYQNLDEFASRAKPSASDLPDGEMEENITLILKAYTDSGYSNLKWTYERIVTVHWINSTDAAFTVDELDNFDDGTVQGWAAVMEQNNDIGFPTIAVATDYVLSTQYSCKMTQQYTKDYTLSDLVAQVRSRLYKSFSTPNKTKVFAIIDVRISGTFSAGTYEVYQKDLKIQKNSDVLVFLGRGYDTVLNDYVPKNKWMRIVVPLPANTTIELRIIQEVLYRSYYTGLQTFNAWLWLDDFKLLSK